MLAVVAELEEALISSNMVRVQELIEAVIYSLEQSEEIPDRTSFIDHVPNIDTEAIKLPVISVYPGDKTYLSDANSDFVQFTTDGDGNQTGRMYESLYTVEVTIAVYTAEGSQFSARAIMDSVRDKVFTHESSGLQKPLRNPDDSIIDDVWRVAIQSGEQNDDFGTSPTLRRWEQTITIQAGETFTTEGATSTSGVNLNTDVN